MESDAHGTGELRLIVQETPRASWVAFAFAAESAGTELQRRHCTELQAEVQRDCKGIAVVGGESQYQGKWQGGHTPIVQTLVVHIVIYK